MTFNQLKLLKIIIYIFILCSISSLTLADNSPTPAWYRYYDRHGVATISSSVSSAHIQQGYDVLDRRMQIIRHVPAFSAERSQQNAQSYGVKSQQHEADLRLKQAYSSSRTAELKKQEALKAIKIQINIQQNHTKDTYQEQVSLRREELQYIRQGKSVPAALKNRIQQNDQAINHSKNTILDLQNNYRDTQLKYDKIISRLKLVE
ncbi:hypothetical protein [Acinetobacter sp. ANC 4641]|uniref:hypothetical protein n=1 Tax=Acinetobacter sp. ANC 4641 TaxID=2529847 RepID=UPI00103EDA71|nr:hypothetical protein [Acinetobacter sp. ANC 4641]TCB13053.1 hypothetical protein E0H78_00100 [Acinetobacter sp. ANC 4641]